MNTYERRQQNKTAAEIQNEIRLIRLAYERGGFEPLNEHRSYKLIGWVALGMTAGAILAIAGIAAQVF